MASFFRDKRAIAIPVSCDFQAIAIPVSCDFQAIAITVSREFGRPPQQSIF